MRKTSFLLPILLSLLYAGVLCNGRRLDVRLEEAILVNDVPLQSYSVLRDLTSMFGSPRLEETEEWTFHVWDRLGLKIRAARGSTSADRLMVFLIVDASLGPELKPSG